MNQVEVLNPLTGPRATIKLGEFPVCQHVMSRLHCQRPSQPAGAVSVVEKAGRLSGAQPQTVFIRPLLADEPGGARLRPARAGSRV